MISDQIYYIRLIHDVHECFDTVRSPVRNIAENIKSIVFAEIDFFKHAHKEIMASVKIRHDISTHIKLLILPKSVPPVLPQVKSFNLAESRFRPVFPRHSDPTNQQSLF